MYHVDKKYINLQINMFLTILNLQSLKYDTANLPKIHISSFLNILVHIFKIFIYFHKVYMSLGFTWEDLQEHFGGPAFLAW